MYRSAEKLFTISSNWAFYRFFLKSHSQKPRNKFLKKMFPRGIDPKNCEFETTTTLHNITKLKNKLRLLNCRPPIPKLFGFTELKFNFFKQ